MSLDGVSVETRCAACRKRLWRLSFPPGCSLATRAVGAYEGACAVDDETGTTLAVLHHSGGALPPALLTALTRELGKAHVMHVPALTPNATVLQNAIEHMCTACSTRRTAPPAARATGAPAAAWRSRDSEGTCRKCGASRRIEDMTAVQEPFLDVFRVRHECIDGCM
jgi:hypothetical protein